MALSLVRFQAILLVQYLLLVVDLVLNTGADLFGFSVIILLIIYVLQDVCILFAIIVVFLMFFNTYIFQAGLVHILVKKFRFPIAVTGTYFVLSVVLHIWTMGLRWNSEPSFHIWDNTAYLVMYTVQRFAAVFHLYSYKRTSLRLADPQFYEDSAWIREQFDAAKRLK